MRAAERGASLIEVIAALVILGTAGTAALSMALQTMHAVERLRAAEAEMRAASAFLEAVALWPRADLDRRLGERAQGDWRLRIDRPVPGLYLVSLRDSLGHELLRTSLHRSEAPDDEP